MKHLLVSFLFISNRASVTYIKYHLLFLVMMNN